MEWLIWLLIVAFAGGVWLYARRSDTDNLGIKGKLIWTDHGRQTKPFFNSEFQVFGKPDLMYKTQEGILAVEFKSRKWNIYQSDITQAKCAALSARGAGYQVTRILVKTAKAERYFPLPRSDKALFKEIESSVAMARKAKRGVPVPSVPERLKCRSCAHNASCAQSAVQRAS